VKYFWSGLWFAAICLIAACAVNFGEKGIAAIRVDDVGRADVKRELPESAPVIEEVLISPAKKASSP
jgi:hypothetical protein